MKKDNWMQIGSIGVDSGLVYIGDPCYFVPDSREFEGEKLDKDEKPPEPLNDWCNFVDSLGESYPTLKSFPYKSGYEGLGVCVSSGFGDGKYKVMANIVNVPGWGQRVKEVKIIFIEEDEICNF